MGSTYHSLHFHWVCSTKERRPLIHPRWRPSFWEYLGGTLRGLGGVPIQIGGVEDHVHALVGLRPTHSIADISRELKKASSVWAAAQREPRFGWQDGYSIFAVSKSLCPRVARYIELQEEHHRNRTFVEELKELLERHGIEYNPKYLV